MFWTLCIEVQFYLVYALLLCLRLDWRALFLASAFSLLWPFGLAPDMHGVFLPLWHGFLLGAAAYWTLYDNMPRTLFLLFTAAVLGGSLWHGNAFSICYAATALVIFVVGSADKLHTLLAWRWLQFLGAISYSLYLIHNPIIGASMRVGYMLTDRNAWTAALWSPLAILACILVASAMWAFIERPSMNLSRRIALSKAPAGQEQRPLPLKT